MGILIPSIDKIIEKLLIDKNNVKDRYEFLADYLIKQFDNNNITCEEENPVYINDLFVMREIDDKANRGMDINELFYSEIKWNSNLIDYAINTYKDKFGNFSTVKANGWGEESTQFTDKQIGVINWNSANILKYFDFITESILYNGCKPIKIDFVGTLYVHKLLWTYDELLQFREYNDWYQLSKIGNFEKDRKIFQEFKYEIRYDLLITNKRFDFDKELLFSILLDKTIRNMNKPSFEDVINSNFLIDIDVFNFYSEINLNFKKNEKTFFNLITNGNLTEELIIHLVDYLNLEYEYKYSYRKRSGGDVDYFEVGYNTLYWNWLCKNPNIIWNDNLINIFADKLVFETLTKVEISYKTIKKMFNYNRTFSEYHFDFGKENVFFEKECITFFNSVLIKCDIIDFDVNLFLDNEINWFKLWFNESLVNNFIANKLSIN